MHIFGNIGMLLDGLLKNCDSVHAKPLSFAPHMSWVGVTSSYFTFINERRNIADSDDSAWAWDTNFTETAPHLLFSINTTMPRKFIQVSYLCKRLAYRSADHSSSQDFVACEYTVVLFTQKLWSGRQVAQCLVTHLSARRRCVLAGNSPGGACALLCFILQLGPVHRRSVGSHPYAAPHAHIFCHWIVNLLNVWYKLYNFKSKFFLSTVHIVLQFSYMYDKIPRLFTAHRKLLRHASSYRTTPCADF